LKIQGFERSIGKCQKGHTAKQYCHIAPNCIWKTSFSSAI